MNIKLLPGATPPLRATEGAAGYDLHANLDGPITLYLNHPTKVPLGVCVEIPSGFVGILAPRSGLGTKNQIGLANTIGVIDSDYRGELIATLVNRGGQPYEVNPKDRIVQLLLIPVVTPELTVVEELSETVRGENGHGSTGT